MTFFILTLLNAKHQAGKLWLPTFEVFWYDLARESNPVYRLLYRTFCDQLLVEFSMFRDTCMTSPGWCNGGYIWTKSNENPENINTASTFTSETSIIGLLILCFTTRLLILFSRASLLWQTNNWRRSKTWLNLGFSSHWYGALGQQLTMTGGKSFQNSSGTEWRAKM